MDPPVRGQGALQDPPVCFDPAGVIACKVMKRDAVIDDDMAPTSFSEALIARMTVCYDAGSRANYALHVRDDGGCAPIWHDPCEDVLVGRESHNNVPGSSAPKTYLLPVSDQRLVDIDGLSGATEHCLPIVSRHLQADQITQSDGALGSEAQLFANMSSTHTYGRISR